LFTKISRPYFRKDQAGFLFDFPQGGCQAVSPASMPPAT